MGREQNRGEQKFCVTFVLYFPYITMRGDPFNRITYREKWDFLIVLQRFKLGRKKKDRKGKKTLVAYGTKYGATAEIAEKIGEVLRQAGLPTDVLPADHVHDLAGYQAVVLGSGVYMGK